MRQKPKFESLLMKTRRDPSRCRKLAARLLEACLPEIPETLPIGQRLEITLLLHQVARDIRQVLAGQASDSVKRFGMPSQALPLSTSQTQILLERLRVDWRAGSLPTRSG